MARTTLSRSNSETGPVATSSPSRRMVIRSAWARASSSAWVMKMMETPDFFRRFISAKKWRFSSGVSVAVGSSKIMTSAL